MAHGSGQQRQGLAQQKLAECSRVVGEAFFPVMVEALAETLSVRWVLLCTLHPVERGKARTIAVWDDGPGENFEYDLKDTPCANIVSSGTCSYPRGVAQLFPEDITLQDMGADSYVGAPLRGAKGEVLGLLAVLDAKPIEDVLLASELVEVFAGRAAAEIERIAATSINERLGRVVEDSVSEVYVFNADNYKFELVNRGARENLGYSMEELRELTPWDLKPEFTPEAFVRMVEPLRAGKQRYLEFETIHRRKDGSDYDVSVRLQLLGGVDRVFYAAIEDITERKRAREALASFNDALQKRVAEAVDERRQIELQLAQAQKMEAIGKLTGGVAHDFNNLLQVIRGNLDLLAKDVAGNERAERRVQNALTGAIRGAKLASQLLAFGRRQPLEPRPLNLGRVIRELDDMLQRTLGEGIELETVAAGGLWNCLADPTHVENAILNLAINARDAMNGRGKLTIEAGNASLDDEYVAQHADLTPGQYVMIAVTDTGCGIPADKLEQVFEPFYTTKPEGEGTGLGLSMVYGFVKQSGGHVKIYSEVGHGTTVRLYLPRTRRPEEEAIEGGHGEAAGGAETVLLVEDDDGVRATAAEMLIELGYNVLRAQGCGRRAGDRGSGAVIDLLFTDVVMPGTLRSTELADLFLRRFPNGAVLYTSGYTQNAIVHAGRLDEGVELLSKPYSREALSKKVRQVLDAADRAGGEAKDGRASAEQSGRRGQRTVLLLEDEALIRLNTADMLAEMNFTVIEAATAEEARALLARRNFDILVADLTLPDGSGFDVARAALAHNDKVKIVFASGRAEQTPPDLASAAWLPKPYDFHALAAAVGAALQPAG